MLFIGAVIVVISIAAIALAWDHNLDTVHAEPLDGTHAVYLPPGKYQIYQDPGTAPDPPNDFAVVGPSGRVALQPVSGLVSPFDATGPLLRIGLFIPAVTFDVHVAGTYQVTVAPNTLIPPKIFIAETRQAAVLRVFPGIYGLAAGILLLVFGFLRPSQVGRGSIQPT